jgi:hypothetical protein
MVGARADVPTFLMRGAHRRRHRAKVNGDTRRRSAGKAQDRPSTAQDARLSRPACAVEVVAMLAAFDATIASDKMME